MQEELLIDEIAENVFLAIVEIVVGVGGILLEDFLLELVAAANVFGAGDDLVVDSGDDLFDYRVGREIGDEKCSGNG